MEFELPKINVSFEYDEEKDEMVFVINGVEKRVKTEDMITEMEKLQEQDTALEQQACEDCISRADLINLLIPKIKTRRSTIEIKHKLIPLIKSLKPIQPKEIYNKGWKDGAEATAYHVELCEEENPTIPLSVIEDIKANIKLAKYASKDIPERALIYSNGWDDALDVAIDVIDKHIAERGSK